MHRTISRRDFFRDAAVFSVLGGLAPQFLTRTAEGAAAISGFKDDRVLVVLQLGGGNDGLNTLVPCGDDAYYNARPVLGLRGNGLVKITDGVAFNAGMTAFMRMYDDGKLAIVQGVGYPNPDRSHFRSMEIWHTASDADQYESSGWIGRYFDHECSGSARPHVGVALGKDRPQAFDGRSGLGVSFEDPRRFGWQPGEGADSEENFARLNAPQGKGDSTIDFLRHVTSNAIMSSHEVREAADRAGATFEAKQPLARSLETVADLIRGGLQTRIYYVSLSGFDTHANQLRQHNNLLAEVGESLRAFQQRLANDGASGRVLTMVFSEFGRRVHENRSGGTDHGTAAPMFLLGDHVKPGLFGEYPSLTNLDDGDLIHTVDFRSVYSSVLQDWFGINPKGVLRGTFEPTPIIA